MVKRRRYFTGMPIPLPEKVEKIVTETLTSDIDQQFITLVKKRNYLEAIKLSEQVKNINIQDKFTGNTALHYAANRCVIGLVEVLEQRKDLDYLIVNNQGHRASEFALETAHLGVRAEEFEELGVKLVYKEKEQSERLGISPWPPSPVPGL